VRSEEALWAFRGIWADNRWGSAESRSGRGSELGTTECVRAELARWLAAHPEVRRLLDAPCGDFNWMRALSFPHSVEYIGCDIVPELVEANSARHAAPGRRFEQLDIAAGPIPQADAWLCRDALTHLPFAAGTAVVQRFRESGIRWFLATTYPCVETGPDIAFGEWHFVNLGLPPFGLGPPSCLLADPAENNQDNRWLGVWENPRLAARPAAPLSLVTVAFRREIPFLRLQARSIRRYMDWASIGEIVVVGNDTDNARFAARFEREVLPEYGPLAPRVRFIPIETLTPRNWPSGGWHMQQILKLRAASAVTTPHYVVLDAKNHFVRMATRDSFIAPDGRARSWTGSYRHHFEARFEGSVRRFGLDPGQFVDAFPPSVTPAVFGTETVLAMIADIEQAEQRRFEEVFLATPNGHSEFLLYHAFLAARPGGLESAYAFGETPVVAVFADKIEDEWRFNGVMFRAQSPSTFVFAVHRAAVGRMSARQRAIIADFWTSRRLIDRPEEAAEFLRLDEEDGG
jgi:hypothetical protein